MKKVLILIIIAACSSSTIAQNLERFRNEVEAIREKKVQIDYSKPLILFTGSSSIRLWKNLNEAFPSKQVINTGFGGSTMGELLYYYDDLIKPYKPDKLFVYEGDNDIAMDLETEEILINTRQLIEKVHLDYPDCEIILISPKPSVARWDKKDKYVELNRQFKKLAKRNGAVKFADVWKPALNKHGEPMPELFMDDMLHLNKDGYEIWIDILGKYLK